MEGEYAKVLAGLPCAVRLACMTLSASCPGRRLSARVGLQTLMSWSMPAARGRRLQCAQQRLKQAAGTRTKRHARSHSSSRAITVSRLGASHGQ